MTTFVFGVVSAIFLPLLAGLVLVATFIGEINFK